MFSRILRSVVASNVSALLPATKRIEGSSLIHASRVNAIHTSEYIQKEKNEKKERDKPSALVLHSFENAEKQKEAYLDIVREYKRNNDLRRGHVEFIKVALKYMDDFGVNGDLAVYKDVLDVLPKGSFIPRNWFQTFVPHYPKQQNIAIELLCKMEHNCVIPDVEMQEMLLNIFGQHAGVLKKFWRMMYWMPKFANLNPWPCPKPMPRNPQELARLAVKKITSVDVRTTITDFKTKDVEDAIEDTWIVSGMSDLQEGLLRTQSPNSPIFVEGPHTVWIADQCIDYFVLRGDARVNNFYEDPDDVSNIKIPFWDKKEITVAPSVHEQDDGTYFAVCATGTSTKDSLLSWIRCLEKRNPVLNMIPVVFKLASYTKDQLFFKYGENENENEIVQTKS